MKKLLLIASAALFMFSCSKDEVSDNNTDKAFLRFNIKVVNRLETGTRAAIVSQEPEQNIEIVKVYVCAPDTSAQDFLIVRTINIPDWTLGTTSGSYTVPLPDHLPPGEYLFLAIGRKAVDNYQTATVIDGTSHLSDLYAQVNTPDEADEIFAGNNIGTITSYGGDVQLQMTRVVAGVLGYFKNVPQVIGTDTVASVRLTMSDISLKASPVGPLMYGQSYDVININLIGQTVTDGMYDGNSANNPGVVQLAKSQLAGMYLLPTDTIPITMTLRLYSTTNVPLRTWHITSDNDSTFVIQQNYFYSLGHKERKNNTTGVGGITGNPDVAIDLSSPQDIQLVLDPNWGQFPIIDIIPDL